MIWRRNISKYSEPLLTYNNEYIRLIATIASDEARPTLARIAFGELRRVNRQGAINQICEVWQVSRSVSLANLMLSRTWIASTPLALRVLTALNADKGNWLEQTDFQVLSVLFQLCQHETDLTLAQRANACFENLQTKQILFDLFKGLEPTSSGLDLFLAKYAAGLRVLIALLLDRPSLLSQVGIEIIEPLLELLTLQEPFFANLPIRVALLGLHNAVTQEALCALAQEPDYNINVRELVIAAAYVPRDAHQRALFLFLTEQWEKYQSLDFDQSLLRTVYEATDEALRQRLSRLARQAGRAEFIAVAVGGSSGRIRAMRQDEWQLTLDLLMQGERYDEGWRLAQIAPPAWSLKIISWLVTTAWQPTTQAEQKTFKELSQAVVSDVFGIKEVKLGNTPPLGRQLRVKAALASYDKPLASLILNQQANALMFGLEGAWQWWDLAKNQTAQIQHFGSEHQIIKEAISPDGKIMAYVHSVQISGQNWICNLVVIIDQKEIEIKEFAAHVDHQIVSLAFRSDGKMLAASKAREVFIINLPNCEVTNRFKLDNKPYYWGSVNNIISCLAFSLDNKFLVIGTTDNAISIYNFYEAQIVRTLDVIHSAVTCLLFNPIDNTLISGQEAGIIQVWNIEPAKTEATKISTGGIEVYSQSLTTLYGHYNGVYSLAISPDGRRLASGHFDAIRLWSLPNGKPVKTMKRHKGKVVGLVFTPDGQSLISAGKDGQVLSWSSRTVEVANRGVNEASLAELLFVRQAQRDPALPLDERRWLEFLEKRLGGHFEHEIEIDDVYEAQASEFDIELEG